MKNPGTGGWFLAEDTRELLVRVREAVAGLAPLATSGAALIALGEVWEAIEAVIRDERIYVSVTLSVGFRRADEFCQDGLFMCLRVDSDSIVLDELNTTYSSDVGSDHFTVDYSTLSGERAFDSWEVQKWLAKLAEVLSFDDAQLQTYRDDG